MSARSSRTASLFGDARPAPAGGVYVQVAVERGIDRAGASGDDLRRGATLTYSSEKALPVGRRVEVPLGRGGKVVVGGIVVASGGAELLSGLDPERVKPILRDAGSGLPARLVELAQWMSGYYVCPLGMVLATMMPAAVKKGTGVKSVRVLVRASDAAGSAAVGKLEGSVKRAAEKAWEKLSAVEAAAFPISPKGLAAKLGLKTTGPLKKMVEVELLEMRVERVIDGGGEGNDLGEPNPLLPQGALIGGPPLTSEQARAVNGIVATLGGFGVHLLRGVTGSGKTEVYLRVIAAALERGGGGEAAIVLVPEIALTPQTAARFTERFGRAGGEGVAVLHSGLTASARHGEWDRVSRGAARVVVGARSAVFAPLPERIRLGVIVVDEEHDSSYKQDQLPRYHGRDVAIKRAQLEGCPVVLGSATPSLESWANAIRGVNVGAKYALWELPERVGGGVLPPVDVVDMAEERRRSKLDATGEQGPRFGGGGPAGLSLVGPTLDGAIRRTLEEGGQVILLLNRRGFAHYLTCRDARCGWVCGCEHCDASLVLHRADWGGGSTGETPVPPAEFVRCHHCLEETRVPRVCPVCGKRVGPLAAGTQRAEEELSERYGLAPGVDLLRVDSDSMRSGRDYFEALSRFGRGEVRMLLGTQMVAKGLDFPNVRLVGVLDADTAANLPDFRAAERTFQLVSQVAGRAGRGTAGGRVIVQTLNPGMSAIRLAAMHDYVGFATQELGLRVRAGLPPATKMARVVVRDPDVTKAERHAKELGGLLLAEAEKAGVGVRMLGPAPAPIARIAGQHRIAIELIARRRGDLQALLAALRAKGQLKSDSATAVDVDPVALM
jgi:primosomal protein N' (replication factor Y)